MLWARLLDYLHADTTPDEWSCLQERADNERSRYITNNERHTGLLQGEIARKLPYVSSIVKGIACLSRKLHSSSIVRRNSPWTRQLRILHGTENERVTWILLSLFFSIFLVNRKSYTIHFFLFFFFIPFTREVKNNFIYWSWWFV